jgi:hypothetical protein
VSAFVINPYSVLFTPNRLANLALWLDAGDSNSVTTVSGAVSQWTDKSGNGRNATQSTAGARPTYTTAGLNGLNVLTFNGSDNGHILTTTYDLANTYTIVTVCKKTTQTAVSISGIRPAVASSSGAGKLIAGIGTFRVGFSSPLVDVLDMFLDNTRVDIVEGSWLDNETVIASNTYDGSVLSAWKNGDIHSSPLSASRTGFGAVNIGGLQDFNSRRFAGTIAEVIIMSTSAATADRERIEGYLAHKWGVAANLPAGHPYKTSAP